MQNTLTFDLTDQDIADAKRYGVNNELLYLLANRTGTLWSPVGADAALEIIAPHRSARFLTRVGESWQPFQGGATAALAVRAEIYPTEAAAKLETSRSATAASLPREFEAPQDGIARLAYLFFESRANQAKNAGHSAR